MGRSQLENTQCKGQATPVTNEVKRARSAATTKREQRKMQATALLGLVAWVASAAGRQVAAYTGRRESTGSVQTRLAI